jgi:hypothetical protein
VGFVMSRVRINSPGFHDAKMAGVRGFQLKWVLDIDQERDGDEEAAVQPGNLWLMGGVGGSGCIFTGVIRRAGMVMFVRALLSGRSERKESVVPSDCMASKMTLFSADT